MPVAIDRHDTGVVVLTFDEPERRNAMSPEIGVEVAGLVDELRVDGQVRAVVLTGTPPAFSAGGDLDFLEDLASRTRAGDFDATETMVEFYGNFLSLRGLPVPTIAAINGHAVGAGLCVALACDMRVAAADAKLGLNFSRLGLHPGMGATWLLQRIVGPMHAAHLLYAGQLISGEQAARIGLVLEALPSTDVLPRSIAIANEIAQASPKVVRQLKTALDTARTCELPEALQAEAAAQAVSYGSDDLTEGLAAVKQRRAPRFTGG